MKNLIKTTTIPLLLIATNSIQADTFNVSNSTQLREALENSATNGKDDIIYLTDGIYKTTDDNEGTFIYLSNEENNITFIGSNSNNTILSGDKTHQILKHTSTKDTPMRFENITFIDGNNTVSSGGAIYSDYSIEIVDCNFSNNYAIGDGGAIDTPYSTIKNSIFNFNSSSSNGGALYSKNTDISNSTFSNNKATKGGGFYTYNKATVDNSKYINNSSTSNGGGFYTQNQINISNTLLDGNSANSGGGFYVYSYASVDNNVTFLNNFAKENGGGFYSTYSYNNYNIVNNSFFKNNNALLLGGGFYASRYTITTNSIYKENNASSGGAIYTEHLKASNLIFDSNENTIFLDEKDNIIYNSIFIDNINNSIDGDYNTEITLKNNYIDKNSINIISYKSYTFFDDVNISFTNREDDNYILKENSTFIDNGTSDINEFNLLSIDKNGNQRVSGNSIDIGPYEYNLTKPIIEDYNDSFTISTTDSNNHKITKTINVVINSVDDIPIFTTSILDKEKDEDFSDFNVTLSSYDIENDNVTYKASSLDTSIATVKVIDNTIVVSSIPNKYGIVRVDYNVTQDSNNSLYTTNYFELEINSINDTPTFVTNLSNIDIEENNGTISFELNATDVEGDELNITVESNNTNLLTISPSWKGLLTNGYYDGIPLDFNISTVENANGIGKVTIIVNDGELTNTKSFDINISSVNKNPVVIEPTPENPIVTEPTPEVDNGSTESEIILEEIKDDLREIETGTTVTIVEKEVQEDKKEFELQLQDNDTGEQKESKTIIINNTDSSVIVTSNGYEITGTVSDEEKDVTSKIELNSNGTSVNTVVITNKETKESKEATITTFKSEVDTTVQKDGSVTLSIEDTDEQNKDISIQSQATINSDGSVEHIISRKDKDGNNIGLTKAISKVNNTVTTILEDGEMQTKAKQINDNGDEITAVVNGKIDGKAIHILKIKDNQGDEIVIIASSDIAGAKTVIELDGSIQTSVTSNENSQIKVTALPNGTAMHEVSLENEGKVVISKAISSIYGTNTVDKTSNKHNIL